MNKQEFLAKLENALAGLPAEEIAERLTFYGEMIDDYVEDALSEEEAVSRLGSVEELASQSLADVPLTKLVKEKIRPKRRMRAWEIVFLVLGSPIWLSLLLAAFAVILAVYISLLAVIVCLWAVFVALVCCALAGIGGGIVFAFRGGALIAVIGGGLVCAGLSVFAFCGCKAATKGIAKLTKKFALWIRKIFVKKEEEG